MMEVCSMASRLKGRGFEFREKEAEKTIFVSHHFDVIDVGKASDEDVDVDEGWRIWKGENKNVKFDLNLFNFILFSVTRLADLSPYGWLFKAYDGFWL